MSNHQFPIGPSAPSPHAAPILRTSNVEDGRFTPHASRLTHHVSRSTSSAFTLVEILVTTTLLALIMVGLFAAFNQVQRAFRSSMSQVDRLEAGRAVTELLPRDLEQITPCGGYTVTYSAQIIPGPVFLTQNLPGMPTTTSPATTSRTNLLQDCFMLTRQNQTWVGIGYCVRTNDVDGRLWLPETGPASGQMGVGSLYRFVTTTNVLTFNGTRSDPSVLYNLFQTAALPGHRDISNRICDGVLHFYLGAYATNGFPIFSDGNRTNAYFCTNSLGAAPPYYFSTLHPAQIISNSRYPGNVAWLYCWSNAVPAAVEMQLGILEQPAWERYNSIPVAAARLAYLQRPEVASRVHLFRQRATVRNVDPSAYQ